MGGGSGKKKREGDLGRKVMGEGDDGRESGNGKKEGDKGRGKGKREGDGRRREGDVGREIQ